MILITILCVVGSFVLGTATGFVIAPRVALYRKVARQQEANRRLGTVFKFDEPREWVAPSPGQTWRFMAEESEVVRILPGGAGDLGIVEFKDKIPPAHVATMKSYTRAWSLVQ